MGLVLNDEQRMLRDAAHEFLKEQSPISALRSLRDSKDDSGFSRELWGKLVELGWTGMTLPERFGGSEFGFGGLAVAFEETGRTLTASPLLSTIVLGGGLINRLGSDPLRNELLPGLIGGKQFLALALDESPRHQPTQIQTEGRRIDNEWVLNGRKTFVLDGHVADTLLVAARTAGADDDPSGISLF
ncbi:MAG: acyl-CoA dehydrogenase, partial [Chromatiales bacterium]|nr:acyl-CoA dehydrogenase [Chromatiales bacterium]